MSLVRIATLGAASLVLPHPVNRHRPFALRHPVLAFLNALLLVTTLGTSLAISLTPEVARLSAIAVPALLRLTNAERAKSGLPLLRENPQLMRAAAMKGEHMLRHDYFEHTSPDGLTPWVWFDRAGYSYRYAGENLAIDFTEAEDIVTAWLRSPGHRRNLLADRYEETGLAVVTGEFHGRTATIIVHLFGTSSVPRAAASPPPTRALGESTAAPAPLPAPTLLEPSSGTVVSRRSARVSGTAPKGSTVTVLLDAAVVGTFEAPEGSFRGTITISEGEERLALLRATATLGATESALSVARRIQIDTKAPELAVEQALLLPDPRGLPGVALLLLPAAADVTRATLSAAGSAPIVLRREGNVLLSEVRLADLTTPAAAGTFTLRVADAHGNTHAADIAPLVTYATAAAPATAPRTVIAAAATRVRPWMASILAVLSTLLAVNMLVHLRAHRLLHPDLLAHAFVVLILGTALVAFT